MRNPQFYVFGTRPKGLQLPCQTKAKLDRSRHKQHGQYFVNKKPNACSWRQSVVLKFPYVLFIAGNPSISRIQTLIKENTKAPRHWPLCGENCHYADDKPHRHRGLNIDVCQVKYIFSTVWWGQKHKKTWWRHQMETSFALRAICAGNSPVPSEFPAQRPVTRSFDVFLDLRLNKRLSKLWWGRRFETPSSPLWRHCNDCH